VRRTNDATSSLSTSGALFVGNSAYPRLHTATVASSTYALMLSEPPPLRFVGVPEFIARNNDFVAVQT
jgi:hypothetical protein